MIRKADQAPLRTISTASVSIDNRVPLRASSAITALDSAVMAHASVSAGPCARPRHLVTSSTLNDRKASAAVK